ncbi:MAG: TIGR03560 family F420-dependent LLM class oxidoreductase [Acidobacteria bacterium]|nr:TIGR03560 family F420-dependent LLM class oxidoreductase [Acidobacteriota bacterium]
MKVGIALPHYDFSFSDGRPADLDSVVEFARDAEDRGFDSAWMSDHFFLDLGKYGGPTRRYGSLEAFTTLAAVAAATRRVRLGTLVACEAFRPPTLLAKMVATLDVMSGGRVDLGLGAGWYAAEFEAAGIPFPPAAERFARLRESAIIVGGMLERSPFSFEGRHYRAEEAPNEPRPVQSPRPPIWIGGKGGPRLRQVVAEVADGWNTAWRWTPEDYAARVRALRETCERAGRDPAAVRLSLGLIALVGSDRADLEARWRTLQRWAPGGALDGTSLDDYAVGGLVGTPEECAARAREFEALGVEHLILTFGSPPFSVSDPEQPRIVAETLLPLLR